MPSRPKLRIAAMWASTVLSLLLATLLVVSCFVSFSFDRAGTLIIAADGMYGSNTIYQTYWTPIVAVNAGCIQVRGQVHIDKDAAWRVNTNRTAPAFAWVFSRSADPMTKESKLTLPLWAPLLLTAAPALFLRQTARARRRAGLCTACAYDLKGLPPTSPCPECGRK